MNFLNLFAYINSIWNQGILQMAFNRLQSFILILKKQIIYFKIQTDYTSGIKDILWVDSFSL